jgi:hypothetical protein
VKFFNVNKKGLPHKVPLLRLYPLFPSFEGKTQEKEGSQPAGEEKEQPPPDEGSQMEGESQPLVPSTTTGATTATTTTTTPSDKTTPKKREPTSPLEGKPKKVQLNDDDTEPGEDEKEEVEGTTCPKCQKVRVLIPNESQCFVAAYVASSTGGRIRLSLLFSNFLYGPR